MVSSSRRSLFLVLSILLLCGCMGAVFGQRSSAVEGSSDGEIRDNIKEFTQVYDLVEKNYAEPVNPDKAIYNGAIPGMLRVLDPPRREHPGEPVMSRRDFERRRQDARESRPQARCC